MIVIAVGNIGEHCLWYRSGKIGKMFATLQEDKGLRYEALQTFACGEGIREEILQVQQKSKILRRDVLRKECTVLLLETISMFSHHLYLDK